MCTYKREIRKKKTPKFKSLRSYISLEVAVILNSTHNKNARFNFCFVFELKLFLKGIPSKTETRESLNNFVQTSKPSC